MFQIKPMTGFPADTLEIDARTLAPIFADISAGYKGFQVVVMPPNWREQEPVRFTFVVYEEELSREELRRFFEISAALELPNARPISRRLLELASIFHPLFYMSFTSGRGRACVEGELADFIDRLHPYCLKLDLDSTTSAASAEYFAQSLLFLAGCTLSAAVIQNRFSEGTIDSKLNRLWQVAQYAERFGYTKFQALKMEDFVIECSRHTEAGPVAQLIEIKKAYGKALASLSDGLRVKRCAVRQESLSTADQVRFGFIDDLRDRLGANLQCVLVYGSSVTSLAFADYDLVVVVKDAGQALGRLAGANPAYMGKEINLSVYDLEDFITFQAMSGDNLNHNARCLYGEAEIPIKPDRDLMIRNFSFAFIRLRQLLGMAGYLARQKTHGGLDGQTNLYEYFVKIPMHIMKGVRSVAHEPISKEYINSWTASELGYDLTDQMALIRARRFTEAIANAYLATHSVISHLNDRYQIFHSRA
jgi:hypothetical protein